MDRLPKKQGFRDGERVFRTYFIGSRGDEAMGSTWRALRTGLWLKRPKLRRVRCVRAPSG
jgi:hypothetical protein